MFKPIETDFNIDRHLINFLQDAPFFAELSRHITKVATDTIPTLAIAYNEKADELQLGWNPKLLETLSPWEIRGVLTHELYHIVFGHIYGRRRTPHKLWNVATDLAINSIITTNANNSSGVKLEGDRILPEWVLMPGVFPKHPEGRAFSAEEKQAMKLATIIEKLPGMQASEWYFEKIKEEAEKMGSSAEKIAGDDAGDVKWVDSHEFWDSVPEEMREYVESKVKALVEKAVKHADSQANGWGNIPSELVDAIRQSVSNIINWRAVLRQFVGHLVRGNRSTTIKRINKRYPYIHPGTKRGYVAKLLIAIDQSGSVSNEMLVEFFGELSTLTKKVTIDVLPFDCSADEKDIFTWHRGANVPPKRVRGGGTDFDAPTSLANNPKNRGRWDGMLILTDGEAPAPGASRIKRGWVLGKGCKLMFASDEIQVHMTDEQPMQGAWR